MLSIPGSSRFLSVAKSPSRTWINWYVMSSLSCTTFYILSTYMYCSRRILLHVFHMPYMSSIMLMTRSYTQLWTHIFFPLDRWWMWCTWSHVLDNFSSISFSSYWILSGAIIWSTFFPSGGGLQWVFPSPLSYYVVVTDITSEVVSCSHDYRSSIWSWNYPWICGWVHISTWSVSYTR